MKIVFVLLSLVSLSALANDVVWRSDKKALAFCDSKEFEETVCFVVVNSVSTNVSIIENKNLGKLGIAPKSKYEKVKTTASQWKRTGDDGDLVVFKTQAWKDGQRYTTEGFVFVDSHGKYIHQ
ncbi:hypothetical protein FE810_02840 [Thalassotalea litorea]|uniref:Uncharacterized protein n=1 Tax=Thalassotalea litorea TaxID=2020715 RepID=A0A5R9IVN8_9GAMM|nr:hypothetical protein [Thalassotalea litorea]TLU67236.1 hypothetical protein FE810_02840 [Thalassotalea litorea]